MKKILVIAITAMFVSGAAVADQQQQQGQVANANVGNLEATNGGQLVVNGDYYAEGFEGDRGIDRSENVQTIRYTGEYDLNTTPNVSAPALTTTLTETCMGSTSVGGAVTGFGLSFGTTWRDSACVRRLDARELNSLGYRLGAKERMCDDQLNREALARAGTPCYVDLPVEAKRPEDQVIPVPVPVEEAPALGENTGFDWQKLGG